MATQPFLPFDDEPEPAVEPGPAPRSSRLIQELARMCGEQPLAEKVLVATSLPIGHQLLERLGREGHPWMNLRVETVRTLAHGLVGADLAREGRKLLSRAQALALVEQACGEALGEKAYFGPLRDRPGFHRAVHRTFDELRAAGISPAELPEGAFSDKRKRRELKAILVRYDRALTAGGFVDAAEVLRRAVAAAPGNAPEGALYLLPEGQELTAVERFLLERIAGGRLVALATDPPGEWARNALCAKLFRATGEENEIREAFRRILANGSPFDAVEILHTDASTYPALCWELSREHGIPCTFSGGVAAPFTRPGQAALAFLNWISQGFAADVLREALASGALTFERTAGHAEGAPGTRAAARSFREARIGWGARRHRTSLDRLVAEIEKGDDRAAREDAGPDELEARDERRARRAAAARRARDFAARALELATEATHDPCDLRPLARGCRTFVSEFARVGDELDGMALAALEKLLAELEVLSASQLSPAQAGQRLADAVRALSVGADRPRPGRLHIADYRSGGFSGRRETYLLGLDEARHPGDDLEDPVLLDEERRAINRILAPAALALHRDRPRDAALALRGCVSRLTGALTASYSSWKLRSLDQQSEQFPSPFFLDLYRASSGSSDADYSALLAALPVPAGFAPGVDFALDDTEWWLSRLRAAGVAAAAGAAAPIVRAFYPHLADGHRAETARDSDAFTIWDGFVESGTPELDPRTSGQPQSASRIETLAQCPFRYFLKHVLRIEPPEEVERDTTRWLDPMKAGSLLHEVFRAFFEEITASGEKPDAVRHAGRIEELAETAIVAWREKIPPASELAFEERRQEILLASRTFLRLEEEHCRSVEPRYFEVAFGLPRAESRSSIASPEPVAIAVGSGSSFLLRGSIDRVDEAPDGTFHVWDYKTGSAYRYRAERGIHGGRQIQHALYAMALEQLLARAGSPAHVSRSGYFFPGRKGEGQRLPIALDPLRTREVTGRLLDLLRAGAFPHAANKEDCRFCDYESVCGGEKVSRLRMQAKLGATQLPVLRTFREIHESD